MKRSPSSSPSLEPSDSAADAAPAPPAPPVTPPRKKKAKTSKSPKSVPSSDGTASPSTNGVWTPTNRADLVERVFALGYRALDMDATAAELGFTRVQISNALQRGRKGNLRDKVIKAVSDE